jgi:biotin transport system permease protein
MAAVVAALALAYLAQGLRFAQEGARLLRQLWPFFVILGLWHLWLAEPRQGLLLAGRMLAAVALANLVTMTTRLDAMLVMLERLLTPLAWLGLRPRIVALAMALVIRFVPVLLDKATQLRQAWRARSPRRVGVQIVLPLALAALDDADHVAEALRARGGL